jgi:hypothetical protein
MRTPSGTSGRASIRVWAVSGYADGTMKVLRYGAGDTHFSEHSPEAPKLHDLENVGEAPLRFITVELLE